MRSKDSLIRLQRFRVEECRRQALDIEAMIAEFERKERELEQQVSDEEQRTGATDPSSFNYPTAARAARERRENLLRSIADLRDQSEDARETLDAEEAELRKLELLVEKAGAENRRSGMDSASQTTSARNLGG